MRAASIFIHARNKANEHKEIKPIDSPRRSCAAHAPFHCVLSEAEMGMDFLGVRSPPTAATQRPCERTASPQQGMPFVARRHEDEHSRFAAPKLSSPMRPRAPNPDVPAGHHRKHSTAPSSQVHAIGTRVPLSQAQFATSFAASTRVVNGVQAPPVVANLAFQSAMPTSYLQGSTITPRSSAAPNSTAQLTIFYAGSVRVFDIVPREKAEQIMLMAAKATQAGSPPVRQPLLLSESAALPNERQMAVWDQAHAKAFNDSVRLSPDTVHAIIKKTSPQAVLMPGDVPLARNASLARFLERRKQRVATAAMPYSRSEKSPVKMDTFPIVSPGNKIPFGNMEQSWVFGNANNMNRSHEEEALDTELKI